MLSGLLTPWYPASLALSPFVPGHPDGWEEQSGKELVEEKWVLTVVFVLKVITNDKNKLKKNNQTPKTKGTEKLCLLLPRFCVSLSLQ